MNLARGIFFMMNYVNISSYKDREKIFCVHHQKLATMDIFKTLDGGSSDVVIEVYTLKKCPKVMLGIAEDFISMCEKYSADFTESCACLHEG